MKCQIPQISWHGREPVLSVDFQILQGEVRRLVTGGTDTHVIIWYVNLCPKNIVTVECACDLTRHNKSVNIVRFSPNGEYLASGDDEGGIFIWKLRETNLPDLDGEEGSGNKEHWHPFKLLRGHLDDISDLCWSPESDYMMSGSIDNTVFIWDISKGQCMRMVKDAKSFVQGVAWDPLTQCHASISSDRILRIFNATNGKILQRVHKLPLQETTDKNGKSGKLFHDDTLQSFCRRLTFTPDGELLFVPSGIREKGDDIIHTTYVFSRYEFSQPILHLPTGQKYTVAVRCCPILFKLFIPKENISVKPMINLPYRMLIAVATQDSVLLYDTQQLAPFGYITNIHYTHLTDLAWSSDGRMLIVSSTDGYCSFIIFSEGELGEVYIPEKTEESPVSDTVSVEVSPNENCSSKNSKHDLSLPVENANIMNDGRDLSNCGEAGKSPSDKKKIARSIRSPSSIRKKPKICTIKNFFSPPENGKIKKGEISRDSDDCIITWDSSVACLQKSSCNVPTPTVIITDVDKNEKVDTTEQISVTEKDLQQDENQNNVQSDSISDEIRNKHIDLNHNQSITLGLEEQQKMEVCIEESKVSSEFEEQKVETCASENEDMNVTVNGNDIPVLSSCKKTVSKLSDVLTTTKVVTDNTENCNLELKTKELNSESSENNHLDFHDTEAVDNASCDQALDLNTLVVTKVTLESTNENTDVEMTDVGPQGTSIEQESQSSASVSSQKTVLECATVAKEPSEPILQTNIPAAPAAEKPKKRIQFITISNKVSST